MNKNIVTLCGLVITVMLLSAFMPQQEEFKAKNLQVLPKNISHDDLDKVMDGFKAALGVKCSFCHATRKDDPKKLDFASDEKPQKEMARKMIRMTAKINKKYFNHTDKSGKLIAISCVSCHNGKERPQII